MSDIQVLYESTPNPQSMKFVVTEMITTNESLDCQDSISAMRSPLAQKLFGFPWAESVFIGPNFVTVTKQDWVDWDIIADPLSHLIKEHIESGSPVLLPNQEHINQVDETADSDVVKKIKFILNNEVRPAVAMDGGDIVFQRFEEGIVYVYMQGACAGCPSSTITLKQGIEARLCEAIAEVKGVEQVF